MDRVGGITNVFVAILSSPVALLVVRYLAGLFAVKAPKIGLFTAYRDGQLGLYVDSVGADDGGLLRWLAATMRRRAQWAKVLLRKRLCRLARQNEEQEEA